VFRFRSSRSTTVPPTDLDAIRAASDADPRIRGLRLSRNFGKESALCAALDASDADAVVVMDGDLQHPPGISRK
jgi:glycosyltransferase involved in cell wall biosynthesis